MYVSFPNRLILIIVVTILIPTVLINFVTFSFIKEEMQTEAASWLQRMTVNTGETMDSYTKLLEGITKNPAYDYTLMGILETHQNNKNGLFGYSFDDTAQINGMLSMIWAADRKSLVTVDLFDSNGNRFRIGEKIKDSDTNWVELTKQLHGESIVTPPSKLKDGRTLFSMSRLLYNPQTFKEVGMIRMYFLLDFLKPSSNEMIEKEGFLLLVDDSGHVLFDNRQFCDNKLLTDCIGPNHFKSSYKSEVTGWTLVGAMPVSQLFYKINRIQQTILLVNVFFFVIALLVITGLSYRISLPIKKLSRMMHTAPKVQFHIQVAETNRKDEIGMITSSFRQMLSRMQELIAEITDTEQRRKRSEILALQAQINPHFLNNTLSAIAMQAEIDGNYNISGMASQLGKLLRYAIGQEKEWVDVKRECEHIELYMQIMKYRYPKVKLELDVDEQVLKWSMIKLLLQPIVENAILHGIVPNRQEGTVRIWITAKARETLCIVIEDSGIGMDDVELTALRNALSGIEIQETTTREGIGIRNVYERIRLAYGDGPIRFDVESEKYQGTRFILELPRIEQYERTDR
ncbi:HAMP domain-containing protein [Paenibacillus sp. LMG 31458]|uniref:HAMP domain-containing protein n=1 Tax=Paenibacillus phytorum TaxID=2654977 RepID=A0ABX1XS70_9BACL|nr:sensor histidine kinase [Paenibacillus phytorum]NOU71249.1 HAMP domain-containing protein [Paenibacillus phytorum]